jgi:hypothetical protein
MLPLSHITVKFLLEGESFDVEHFDINFDQPVDFRGQPQQEIRGGQMNLRLTQVPTDNLYIWGSKSTFLKSGVILFQTDMGMTVSELEFSNAYCVDLRRKINSYEGTYTVLVLAPEIVKLNGVEHNNFWAR